MFGYKFLTDSRCSYRNTEWIPGLWKQESGGEVGSAGTLHCYKGLFSALSVHNVSEYYTFGQDRLWLCEYENQTDGTKTRIGCSRLRILECLGKYTDTMNQLYRCLLPKQAAILDDASGMPYGGLLKVAGGRYSYQGVRHHLPEVLVRITGLEECRKEFAALARLKRAMHKKYGIENFYKERPC